MGTFGRAWAPVPLEPCSRRRFQHSEPARARRVLSPGPGRDLLVPRPAPGHDLDGAFSLDRLGLALFERDDGRAAALPDRFTGPAARPAARLIVSERGGD